MWLLKIWIKVWIHKYMHSYRIEKDNFKKCSICGKIK